jgi:eukaryotic-like serine/threonine-protein kinase
MLPFDSVVLNKYRILRSPRRRDGLLGKGAFGNVYLAHEQLADRYVAIKELGLDQPDLESHQEEALRRFLTEGRLGLRVRHPNILEVYAIEPYEQAYLLVMELAESGDLKQLLAQERPQLSRAVAVGIGIAEGLQNAHEHGIIHRDLKPGNVFIMSDGTPKVADFGVAHIPEAVGGDLNLTRIGFQPGTIIYMSPEQTSGRKIDHRSDLYSLAVMLFELMTGEFYVNIQRCRELVRLGAESSSVPEELRFFQAFAEVAFGGPIQRPSELNPEIPAWLDLVVMRGLARNPDDRWQSGREFAAALRSGAIDGVTAPAVDPSADATVVDDRGAGREKQVPPGGGRSAAAADAQAPQPPPGQATVADDRGSGRQGKRSTPHVVAPAAASRATGFEPPETTIVDAEAGAAYFKPPASTPKPERSPAAPELDLTYVKRPDPPAYIRPLKPVLDRTVAVPADGVLYAGRTERAVVAPALGARAGGLRDDDATVAVAARESMAPTRWRRVWLFAVPVVAAAAIAAVVVAKAAGGGGTVKPPATVAGTQVAAVIASVTRPPATVSPSPSASPTAPPPRAAAQVPDGDLLRPGTTLVKRENIAGAAGDPGQIVVYSQSQATGAGGCQQPFIDLFRRDATGKWTSAWDATKSPAAGGPLLPDVQKTDRGCFPAVSLFVVRPLALNEKRSTVASIASSDDSRRVAVFAWDETKKQVTVPFDMHTTPSADAKLSNATPATIELAENAYPPASSGLNPDYGRPSGRLSELLTWQAGTFVPGSQKLTPNCLAGKVSTKAATDAGKAIALACVEGSPGPYSAAAVTSDTAFAGGVTFDDLAAGDDVLLTLVDGSLASADPLQALPVAATLQSPTALARKQAKSATPTPPPATRPPTVTVVPPPVSTATRPPAVPVAPQPAVPVAPQPVAPDVPPPVVPAAPPPPTATLPPTSAGGVGISTQPPSSAGGVGISTQPPTSGGGVGISTQPPTPAGGVGGR